MFFLLVCLIFLFLAQNKAKIKLAKNAQNKILTSEQDANKVQSIHSLVKIYNTISYVHSLMSYKDLRAYKPCLLYNELVK